MEVHRQVKYLGKKIEMLRMSKGISRDKLSDMSGVGETTIMMLEHGRTVPRLETICKIASALGYKLTLEMK